MLIASDVLLPALALTSTNKALEESVWSLLKNCPIQQRYQAYSALLKQTYLAVPALTAKMIQAHRDFKKFS